MSVAPSNSASFEDLGLTQIRTSIDALTVSLTSEEVNEMHGPMVEAVGRQGCDMLGTEGKAWRGFQKTRSYGLSTLNAGALWYRKFAPQLPAPTLGPDYESWEVMGPGARILADVLKSAPIHVGRASRIDAAFDFACEQDFWPPTIEDAISDHCEQHGFQIAHHGERTTRTVYVGSRSSERRVRIYRHDLAHGGAVPIIRVEPELHGRFAREAWQSWEPDGGAGLSLCAGHVEHLTGLRVAVDDLAYPAPAIGRDIDLIETAAHGTTQYGGAFEALLAVGVDLAELIRSVREQSLSPSGERVRAHKIRRLLASVRGQTPDQIIAAGSRTRSLAKGAEAQEARSRNEHADSIDRRTRAGGTEAVRRLCGWRAKPAASRRAQRDRRAHITRADVHGPDDHVDAGEPGLRRSLRLQPTHAQQVAPVP